MGRFFSGRICQKIFEKHFFEKNADDKIGGKAPKTPEWDYAPRPSFNCLILIYFFLGVEFYGLYKKNFHVKGDVFFKKYFFSKKML